MKSCTVWAALALTASLSAADIGVVEEIIAKVNGDIITRSEMERTRRAVEADLKSARHEGPRNRKSCWPSRDKDALRDAIDQLLLVQKGKEMSINVETDVSKYLAEIQKDSPDRRPRQVPAVHA